MKNAISGLIATLLLAGTAEADDKQALAAEGKAQIQAFAKALQSELKQAMQQGGPVSGIEVCNIRAPEIAMSVAEASDGWSIARSSHKLRNPDNAPDPYTAAAIEVFLDREAAGEPAAEIVQTEILEEDGERVFRMVRAIPTAAACLACHGGDEVSVEVEEALASLYPSDQARGFAEGAMRGVFTLHKVLP
ncbi:DUF3365 domain-containing protein [Rhodobacteraceae bacterium NNCM2]|nr:DUF3365 domain-containing protein [Coraliihabitans acroporae]